MSFKEKYYNKKVLILGLGKTGLSIASFLEKIYSIIYIWDDDFKKLEKIKLKKYKRFSLAKTDINNFKAVIVSPGFKKDHFIIKKAMKKNINVINDIELFWESYNNKKNIFIGVTGTNGKSTIALMIAKVLQTKPLGNYGNPVLDFNETEKSKFVIELSSFQLDYIESFKPDISIISNITKDHISHHKNFKNYLKAKMNLVINQSKKDFLIVNYDDENIKKYLNNKKTVKPKIIYVSNKTILKDGITIIDNYIIDNFFSRKKYFFKENKFLKISHNKLNFAISFVALLVLGKNPDYILKNLLKFKGLPHRLEFLGTIKKVNFYNDSKATNVAATCSALKSFKKVILIAGGSDKGDNFEPLVEFSKVIYETFLFGETANIISNSLNSFCKNNICVDLDEAINKSFQLSLKTKKYYPILFSPACASFDNYKNFEKRGEHFKKLFNVLSKDAA